MRYSSLTAALIFVLFWIRGEALQINRGTATMMMFGDNSGKLDEQGNEGLVKRNRGTWYSGPDLRNAACYGRKGLPTFSARVSDMIGAMAMQNFEYCYKCMRITNTRNHHTVEVKIVDKCAACKVGAAIDLTPGAFERLNPEGLADGVIDITWKVIPCTMHLHLV